MSEEDIKSKLLEIKEIKSCRCINKKKCYNCEQYEMPCIFCENKIKLILKENINNKECYFCKKISDKCYSKEKCKCEIIEIYCEECIEFLNNFKLFIKNENMSSIKLAIETLYGKIYDKERKNYQRRGRYQNVLTTGEAKKYMIECQNKEKNKIIFI